MSRLVAGALTTLLFLWSSAIAAPSGDSATIPGYERVPLTRGPQNHLLMPATVNGQPAIFLLDS